MRTFRILPHALLAACLAGAVASCNRDAPPRSRDEIIRERFALPRLYLTAETNQRVIDRGDRGVFVDPRSGEICYPASCCLNPACPGRESDEEPFLFIAPDPCYYVTPDGEVGYDCKQAGQDQPLRGACPQCLAGRNLAGETNLQRQQYVDWVQPYLLPETAERIEQQKAELEHREAYIKDRMAREAPAPR